MASKKKIRRQRNLARHKARVLRTRLDEALRREGTAKREGSQARQAAARATADLRRAQAEWDDRSAEGRAQVARLTESNQQLRAANHQQTVGATANIDRICDERDELTATVDRLIREARQRTAELDQARSDLADRELELTEKDAVILELRTGLTPYINVGEYAAARSEITTLREQLHMETLRADAAESERDQEAEKKNTARLDADQEMTKRQELEDLLAVHRMADDSIGRLATFIMDELPGEPSASESAADCAIRLLRSCKEQLTARPVLDPADAVITPSVWAEIDADLDRFPQRLAEPGGIVETERDETQHTVKVTAPQTEAFIAPTLGETTPPPPVDKPVSEVRQAFLDADLPTDDEVEEDAIVRAYGSSGTLPNGDIIAPVGDTGYSIVGPPETAEFIAETLAASDDFPSDIKGKVTDLFLHGTTAPVNTAEAIRPLSSTSCSKRLARFAGFLMGVTEVLSAAQAQECYDAIAARYQGKEDEIPAWVDADLAFLRDYDFWPADGSHAAKAVRDFTDPEAEPYTGPSNEAHLPPDIDGPVFAPIVCDTTPHFAPEASVRGSGPGWSDTERERDLERSAPIGQQTAMADQEKELSRILPSSLDAETPPREIPAEPTTADIQEVFAIMGQVGPAPRPPSIRAKFTPDAELLRQAIAQGVLTTTDGDGRALTDDEFGAALHLAVAGKYLADNRYKLVWALAETFGCEDPEGDADEIIEALLGEAPTDEDYRRRAAFAYLSGLDETTESNIVVACKNWASGIAPEPPTEPWLVDLTAHLGGSGPVAELVAMRLAITWALDRCEGRAEQFQAKLDLALAAAEATKPAVESATSMLGFAQGDVILLRQYLYPPS